MKTIEQFYNEAKGNKELQGAIQEAMENGTCDEFLKAQQVDGTVEDVENYGKSHFKTGELSDDELEAVSGGEIEWGSYGAEIVYDRVQFEFNIGDRVEVYRRWFFKAFTKRATIIDRKVKPDPTTRTYRPQYEVEYDSGKPQKGWVDQNYLSY